MNPLSYLSRTIIVSLTDMIWNNIINIISCILSMNIFGYILKDLPVISTILKVSKILIQHDQVEREIKLLKDKTQSLQTAINQLTDLNKELLKITQDNHGYKLEINQTQFQTFINRIPSVLQPKYKTLITKSKYGYFTDLFYYDPQASIPTQSLQDLIYDLCLNQDTPY